jgi:uncharacterized protein YyaL (SSP411 family)
MGTNRLGEASSAYLQSAAHQPVWWHAWGPEPFERARETDRPVLLDIGAVWCHWCHVMDEESYENPALAEFLNAHFVCVKVDRDERPDVDTRYQRAVQAITRQGGWPLTGFLTPEAELFFGGTYFPPEPAQGRPSFRQILERVEEVWRTERASVARQATALRETLTGYLDETAPGEVTSLALADAGHRILAAADRIHGGFGLRPKFPHPATLVFLLHRWCDAPEATLRTVLERTLDGMAHGGFRDLLGGGFHRYSVDERWIIPHFEKMASDNAELLTTFAAAGALFRRADWLEAASEVGRWIGEVLALPGGGFGASQDADRGSGDDGSYFTWSAEEIRGVVTESEYELAIARYGIGTHGRMPHDPGRNVLFRAATPEELGARFNLAAGVVESMLTLIDGRLRAARRSRPAPFVDPTAYTNWNAMLAGALLRAGPALGSEMAIRHGLETLERLRRESGSGPRVSHLPGVVPGLLDDPVQCAASALEAFEMTGETGWLDWAQGLMDQVWADHWDGERGGLLDIARDRGGEGLLSAPAKPIQDSPNASPNGVAGVTLARLYEHTREERWRERHRALVNAFGGLGSHLGLFASAYLLAADWLVHPPVHLVITGPAGDAVADLLHRRALAAFLPRRVVIRLLPGTDPARLTPALRALVPEADQVRAIACAGDRCLAPAVDPEEWSARLRSIVPAEGSSD